MSASSRTPETEENNEYAASRGEVQFARYALMRAEVILGTEGAEMRLREAGSHELRGDLVNVGRPGPSVSLTICGDLR